MKCIKCNKELEKFSFETCVACRMEGFNKTARGKTVLYNRSYRTLFIKGEKVVFERNYYWAYNLIKYGTQFYIDNYKVRFARFKKKYKIDYKKGTLKGFNRLRERVRVRDKHTCQMCGKKWEKGKRRLDVHHLDIEKEGKKDYEYDRDNMHMLITYCHKCHYSLHTVRKKLSDAWYKSKAIH